MKNYLSSLPSQLSSRRGFTLIELLIVVGIIGILSAFLLSNFVGIRQRARDGVRKSDLEQIRSALELYRSDSSTGSYPTISNWPACGSSFQNSPANTVTYMKKVPCDPLNSSPFVYTYSPGGSTYSIKACLENPNDSQKDSTNSCSGTGNSYTLQNP